MTEEEIQQEVVQTAEQVGDAAKPIIEGAEQAAAPVVQAVEQTEQTTETVAHETIIEAMKKAKEVLDSIEDIGLKFAIIGTGGLLHDVSRFKVWLGEHQLAVEANLAKLKGE